MINIKEGFSVCRAEVSYLGQGVNQLSIEIHGLSFKAVEILRHLTRAICVIQLLRQRIDEGNYCPVADSACVIKFSQMSYSASLQEMIE